MRRWVGGRFGDSGSTVTVAFVEIEAIVAGDDAGRVSWNDFFHGESDLEFRVKSFAGASVVSYDLAGEDVEFVMDR